MHQLLLHSIDLPVRPPPLILCAERLHPLDQDAAVPRPVEDSDVPGLWHLRPETPQVMVSFLDVVWGRDGHNLVPPRIQSLGQPADIAALPGSIPPLVCDYDGHAPKVDLVLELAKFRLGLLQPDSGLFGG